MKRSLIIGKKSEIFCFLKTFFINSSRGHLLPFCQPWKFFSTIVPKTSKFIQKSWSFQDFLSETLLCKCSSGHVESSFDNIATNFPVKTQVFRQSPKKTKKTNAREYFFSTFFVCTLRLMFRHTWLLFAEIRKKLTQSPKKDVNSINYFHHFFSKFCWGHVKRTFSNLPWIFLSKDGYFRSETEKNQTFNLLSKKLQNVPLHP